MKHPHWISAKKKANATWIAKGGCGLVSVMTAIATIAVAIAAAAATTYIFNANIHKRLFFADNVFSIGATVKHI